jgi:hypothetical protein
VLAQWANPQAAMIFRLVIGKCSETIKSLQNKVWHIVSKTTIVRPKPLTGFR